MIKLIINGYRGRMGQALLTCVARSKDLQVIGQVDQGDDIRPLIPQCDVVIDFSSASVTAAITALCVRHKKAIIIGTTGHTEAERSQIITCKPHIPIVWSSNYSTGVNTLFWLTRKAAETLGSDFDIEVMEMHHRHKKDAPSGTAMTLTEILAAARKLQTKQALRYGREGMTGERTTTEIGVHSLRGGDVVGDHMVIFAADGERLELTHRAGNRETFAQGALRAARWVVGKNPGMYDMQDVLGLK